MANARSLSLESRLVAPADGTLNFAGVYAGGSLQQVMQAAGIVYHCSRIRAIVSATLQIHNTENSKQIFPEKDLEYINGISLQCRSG